MFITKLLDSELFFISRRIIEGEKMGKTISIPFWCRYGFLQYLLQKLLNRLIWHICVYNMNFLLEVLFKTTKTAKKTYLYQLGIDMVLAKLNMASLNFYRGGGGGKKEKT